MGIKQWTAKHRNVMCSGARGFFKDLPDDDRAYFDALTEPGYLLFGLAYRSPALVNRVVKDLILECNKKTTDTEVKAKIRSACNLPQNLDPALFDWFEQRGTQKSSLEKAAHKFVEFKTDRVPGNIFPVIAAHIERSERDFRGPDAKSWVMTYLKSKITFEEWSIGLDEDDN